MSEFFSSLVSAVRKSLAQLTYTRKTLKQLVFAHTRPVLWWMRMLGAVVSFFWLAAQWC
jgi:hypothetical protein